MPLIVIDGNIGSGKSTLLHKLQNDNYHVLPEKIADFQPWLELYYTDMKRYALGFQLKVLLSHMENQQYVNSDEMILSERSPLSCLEVFGKHLVNDNILCDLEQQLCNNLNLQYGWMPTKIIYLDVSPKICLQRIKKRSRNGESSIHLEYLESLNLLYKSLYINNTIKNCQIKIINANQSAEDIYQEVIQYLSE